MSTLAPRTGAFAEVNGLRMYHEVHGAGSPLVLVHGGGSTIETTFGRILPALAGRRRVVAVEMQAHGRTPDRDRPLSFAQDADDLAALLDHLGIDRADVLGFSNGGTTALQVALRHPARVRRLVLASATFRRDGMVPGFFDGFDGATLDLMPPPLRDAFLAVNPDEDALRRMFERDVARMAGFEDLDEAAVAGIRAPALVMIGDRDVVLPEHALRLSRTLPDARLAILPSGHGDYLGEICAPEGGGALPALTAAMIADFLDA